MIKTSRKLVLVALNSKVGMKLILDCYLRELSHYFDVVALTEKTYRSPANGFCCHGLTDASSHASMARDTLNPCLLVRIFSILRKEWPDIVYFISAHPLNPVVIAMVRIIEKISGKKIQVVSHIHDVFPHKDTRGSIFIDFFQVWQMKASDKITVYGETLKKAVLSRLKFTPEKVLAVPLGVIRVEEKIDFINNEDNKKYISFIGRIDKYKGIDTFLDVARHFDGKSNVTFYLGGKGDLSPYRDRMCGLSNLKVENRFLTNEEVDDIMKKSYVVVLPYIEASQSAVIPVAYYNACPVITTNVGGLPECVEEGKTGFVVEPLDVDVIKQRILTIINDDTLAKEMGEHCFKYYKENLRWADILKNVVEFLTTNDREEHA